MRCDLCDHHGGSTRSLALAEMLGRKRALHSHQGLMRHSVIFPGNIFAEGLSLRFIFITLCE